MLELVFDNTSTLIIPKCTDNLPRLIQWHRIPMGFFFNSKFHLGWLFIILSSDKTELLVFCKKQIPSISRAMRLPPYQLPGICACRWIINCPEVIHCTYCEDLPFSTVEYLLCFPILDTWCSKASHSCSDCVMHWLLQHLSGRPPCLLLLYCPGFKLL